MADSKKILELTPYQEKTKDHFTFLTVVLVSYSVGDYVYSLMDFFFDSTIVKIRESFLGDFTYPLLLSMLIMTIARLLSEMIPEINLDSTPSLLDFFGSILILTHPLRVYQSDEGLKIRFDIFAMIENGEIIIFIISLLFYFFAIFGVQQILLVKEKRSGTKVSYYLDLLYSDIMPILATFFALIYVGFSVIESSLGRIDLSMMVKMIIYILFAIAALPNVGQSNSETIPSQV